MNRFKDLEQLLKDIYTNTSFDGHCWYVGGYVRDSIIGNQPKDMDIVVDIPNGSKLFAYYLVDVLSQCGDNHVTTPNRLGQYPIWQIVLKSDKIQYNNKTYYIESGETLEIAETMSESFPDEFSRQRTVEYASIKQDVLRRDFSCNSLLKDVISGEIIDYVNGVNDINNQIIKCNPGVKFHSILRQDPLRILRMIIFSVRYNWAIDPITMQAAIDNAERIKIVSVERIINELKKISHVKQGMYKVIKLMDQLNLLQYVFPDIYHLKSIVQAPDVRNIHLEGSEFNCNNFKEIKHD